MSPPSPGYTFGPRITIHTQPRSSLAHSSDSGCPSVTSRSHMIGPSTQTLSLISFLFVFMVMWFKSLSPFSLLLLLLCVLEQLWSHFTTAITGHPPPSLGRSRRPLREFWLGPSCPVGACGRSAAAPSRPLWQPGGTGGDTLRVAVYPGAHPGVPPAPTQLFPVWGQARRVEASSTL